VSGPVVDSGPALVDVADRRAGTPVSGPIWQTMVLSRSITTTETVYRANTLSAREKPARLSDLALDYFAGFGKRVSMVAGTLDVPARPGVNKTLLLSRREMNLMHLTALSLASKKVSSSA
jgi:hypothetical protein